jgi:hypothetical protein
MARAAATNDRGLVIDAIIHLSPENACTFYLVLAGASFAFVLALLFYILPQNFIPRFIILHSNAITLPGAAFDRSHYKVAPGEITHFKLTVVKNRRFLKIYISDRTFPVNPMWLSEPDAFAEIVNWLHAHVPRQAF